MFKYLVGLSAISIALVAAFFSVTGIATLFSGQFIAVVAMASALEIGKLVASSFLYRYWATTAALLKAYLIASVAVLMVITSVGIYGYLSAAYAEIAAVPQNTINQLTSIDVRQGTLNGDIQRWIDDNATLDSRREQVQTSLDNVLDGNTDLSQRSAFANLRTEIELLDVDRRENNDAISVAVASRDSLESVKVVLNAELNTNSEIGTFIYIARSFDLPLDTVVQWFVLIIVIVFDPLAIALILAYNSIVVKEERKKKLASTTSDSEWTKAELEVIEDGIKERLKERIDFKLEKQAGQVIPDEIDDPYMPTVDESVLEEIAGAPKDTTPNLGPVNYDNLPYFHRPGYEWERRRKEWEKDPKAVEFYENLKKNQ